MTSPEPLDSRTACASGSTPTEVGDSALLTVHFNGEPLQVPVGADLSTALSRLGERIDPQRCATAVNGQFVPKAARAARVLADGDAITTFQAIVGG